MAEHALPATHRALVITARNEPLTIQELPTPQLGPGSAVVRILAANVLPYAREAYTGERPYPFPTPMVPGQGAVGRIAAVGPDATLLKAGDLVLADVFIRGRDDRDAVMLAGLHSGLTPGGKILAEGEWRHSTFAEYARLPLENLTKLPEPEEIPGAPTPEDLVYLSRLVIPFGGLKEIGLRQGETIVIAPATGSFGGAAVEMALAMGARVVAAGRNARTLREMEGRIGSARLRTVVLMGDVEKDAAALGPADAFQDWSPPWAAASTHFQACLRALKPGGRASLMGGTSGNVPVPYSELMGKSIRLFFKLMFEPEDQTLLVKMLAAGLLKLGGTCVGDPLPLDKWSEAFDLAKEHGGWGKQVLLAP